MLRGFSAFVLLILVLGCGGGTHRDLVGAWDVVSVEVEDVAFEFGDINRAYVIFAADGSYSGDIPCNAITGDYATTGIRVEVIGILKTSMQCTGETSKAEAALLNAFRWPFEVSIDGTQMVWRGVTGSVIIWEWRSP